MERTRNLRHLETPKAIGSINGSFSDLPVLSEATSGVILPSPVRQTYRSGGETMRPTGNSPELTGTCPPRDDDLPDRGLDRDRFGQSLNPLRTVSRVKLAPALADGSFPRTAT